MKVGILTGGGDCPGLNAVIRSVAKSIIQNDDCTILGFEDGFEGLIEGRYRELSYQDVSGILTRGGTILGTSNTANPFAYFGRNGDDVSDEVVANCHEIGLDALVVIGGDGTMTIADGLHKKGLNIVGVPKTIDNDLVGTERTFGFDTAVYIATQAIDRLHTTAQSHQRVMILETMGRYAGWIALHSGIASGADVILIPELPYQLEEVVRVCKKREEGGQRFTIIAIAEGAKPEGGQMVVSEIIEDSPDPIRLGGIGKFLELQLKTELKSEVRTTILGHVQRGGTPTPFDRIISTSFGGYAASLVRKGIFGNLVTLNDAKMNHIPLSEVANKVRTVPHDSPDIAAALAVGTSFGVTGLSVGY